MALGELPQSPRGQLLALPPSGDSVPWHGLLAPPQLLHTEAGRKSWAGTTRLPPERQSLGAHMARLCAAKPLPPALSLVSWIFK